MHLINANTLLICYYLKHIHKTSYNLSQNISVSSEIIVYHGVW